MLKAPFLIVSSIFKCWWNFRLALAHKFASTSSCLLDKEKASLVQMCPKTGNDADEKH